MGQAVSGLRRIVDSWAGWRDRWLAERSRTAVERQVAQRTAALSVRNDQLRRRIEELEAAEIRAEAASKAEVSLNWRPDSTPLPDLWCDRVRVRQMLLNVLSNAVKFTEPGGSVEIKTEVTSVLELIIRDTGIGIRPEDIARILTPFGQVASVYSRNHQGTGLGLSLTKALIERHPGNLSLYSAPGLGTTVRLSFPADRLLQPRTKRDAAVGLGASD